MRLIRHNPTPAPALDRFVEGVARPRVIVGPGESDELRVIVAAMRLPGRDGANDGSSLVQLSAGIPGTSNFGGEAFAVTE